MDYQEADILVGKVIRRNDDSSFEVKIQYGTRINRANYRGNMIFKPSQIVVNGITYSIKETDSHYVNASIISKQAMFVVRSSLHDTLVGEMFKLPIGDSSGIEIPDRINQADSSEEPQLVS